MNQATTKKPRLAVAPREQAELAHHVDVNMPAAYQPRLLHLSGEMVEGADLFITSRSVIDLKEPAEPNVMPHRHEVSQTYLLLSPDNSLECEFDIDGEHFTARAPATVFVPAGALHAPRILRGTGTVVSVIRASHQAASK